MAQATLHKTLEGHTNEVSSVAFSPDNKLLASASFDNTVLLWNVPNGDLNAELKGHNSTVWSVAFSPDGKSIVTGSYDKTVRTWSVATKQQVKILNGHSDAVLSVAWSPNGDLIASGSKDQTVILWNEISGSTTKKLTEHTNPLPVQPEQAPIVVGASFAADLFVAPQINDLGNNMDVYNGQLMVEEVPATNEVVGDPATELVIDFKPVVTLTITQKKKSFSIRSQVQDRFVRCEASPNETLSDIAQTLMAKTKLTLDLCWLETDMYTVLSDDSLVSECVEGTRSFWLVNKAHTGFIDLTVLHRREDSDKIHVSLWTDIATVISAHVRQKYSFDLAETSLLDENDQQLSLVEPTLVGNTVIELNDFGDWTLALRLISADWIDETNNFVVSFSQNGNKLASAGYNDNTVIIWDVHSGAALVKLAHNGTVWSACFSHDGQFVVTGCGDKIVRMFNANNGHEEKQFEGHIDSAKSVACSFDGSTIASGSRDKSVRLWDVASTKQSRKLDGHTDTVESVAFSRDGKFIASGSNDFTIRLWNAPSLQADLDPTQVAEWSVDDVCNYLKQSKVEDDVVAIFRQEKIVGEFLFDHASHDVLQSIGIKARGDRLRVINAINKLSSSTSINNGLKVHEIPRRELTKDVKLNEGKFGIIWRGTYNGIPVAIKEPKLYGDADLNAARQLADLIEEATVMTSIPVHPNVLHCYGISRVGEDDYLLATELCNLGSLESFLKTHPGTSAVDRRRFSQQVARGLNHLGKHNVAHRDVAARNVLLHDQFGGVIVAKVCDFGLSRQREGEYYLVTGEHLVSPETAPEVFTTGKHSSRSDVWSFGVLLWEVESLCATRAKPNKAAFPPLSKPAQASDNMYEIMLKCWDKDPHQRPSFEALIDMLA